MPSIVLFCFETTTGERMNKSNTRIPFATDMAMAAPVLCPNCDKQEGIVPCLGCKQVFCVKHFQSHRQNLFVELENVVTRRNTLQEHYYNNVASTFDATKLDAWTGIDEWEQQIHEQVRRTADRSSKTARWLCPSITDSCRAANWDRLLNISNRKWNARTSWKKISLTWMISLIK